jgi:hypothetical protein
VSSTKCPESRCDPLLQEMADVVLADTAGEPVVDDERQEAAELRHPAAVVAADVDAADRLLLSAQHGFQDGAFFGSRAFTRGRDRVAARFGEGGEPAQILRRQSAGKQIAFREGGRCEGNSGRY